MRKAVASLLVIILIVVAAAIVIGKTYIDSNKTTYENRYQGNNQSEQNKPTENKMNFPWEQKTCNGTGTVNLASPMKIEDVGLIIPMGAMIGGHVTPIDHMYFSPTIFNSNPDTYDVYADADGVITSIGHEPHFPENKYEKYRIIIKHTCDFYSIYNLLTSLSPEILKITGDVPPGGNSAKTIQVKEGQLLGKIGGQTLDLSVNYDKVILKGFIVPEHYIGESWEIHTVNLFDYFKEPYKSQLLAKDLRQVEPRGGKIDYDIDGHLVGNWFVKGSGGFPERYVPDSWKNHLSFAYDPIDPTHIVVSIGNYSGDAKQSGVKGNSPDPKDITASSGLVKYELVDMDYVLGNGQSWNRFSYANDIKAVSGTYVKGVVLAQMIDDRTIRFEVFPDKTASDVSGFVNPVIYER